MTTEKKYDGRLIDADQERYLNNQKEASHLSFKREEEARQGKNILVEVD